ncbi:MAG TPA: MFS transporter [Chloroflexus aurantiacus]|jgi:EmrB/QacA subfamily drug resistance transporter|uniref:Major facilitator superfamily MFS_1 n=1 Tax=Chloroflexus aurantiacus (strain ATCC 29366 / DSM 635 / J-10-fl) TaxID=324602 RepID=A9WA14_CHLAA|nr:MULTISPECIES: MFS transporter [Chloroflexus]ABY36696.1 major facilitator superfamily MFS_1 [Chloroflexus aurantiacus J-10-fl]RMG50432.1 MAG: MFS transporter [Chloroflexota bacterium]HBW67650.1 MFS transporter [Chloroflexus aurantiacus]
MSDERRRNQILGLLFVGVLMAALDIAIVGPALPAIQRVFGVDERALSWVFSIYVLGNLVGTPTIAALSDRFGRRALYVVSLSGFALGSLLVAIAPSFPMLLLGRLVQGVSAGGVIPVASAVIGDTFPPERRGSALGLIGAVFGIAFLIGPIIGGLLLLIGWQWLFLINLPLAAVLIIFSLRLLPGRTRQSAATFDLAGLIVLGLMLTGLAYGLTELDPARLSNGSLPLPAIGALIVAFALAPIFIAIEQRAGEPILQPAIFRSRQIWITAVLAIGAGIAESAVVFVPALLTAAYGVSSSTASFMLLPVVLAMAIGSPVSGRLLDRFGSRIVVSIGVALSGIGMLILSTWPTSLVAFYLAAVVSGLGLAILLGAALRYILLNEVSANERAAAQGLLTVTMGSGQLLGAVLVGVLAATGGGAVAGYALAFFVIGIVMLLLTPFALALKSRSAERATAMAHAH